MSTATVIKNITKFAITVTAGFVASQGLVGNAHAITMQGASSVSTDMGEYSPSFGVTNMINQSGLSQTYTNGQLQSDYLSSNPLHSLLLVNEWVSNIVTSGNIDFDLGGVFNVHNIMLWNGESQGIQDFSLIASKDSTFNTQTFLGNFTATNNPGALDYGHDLFSFAPTEAQYIRLQVLNTYDFVGTIGEVAFGVTPSQGVPEPTTTTMLGFLVAGGIGTAMKKKLTSAKKKSEDSDA